jgi:pyruvate formate lyase activating enzyme
MKDLGYLEELESCELCEHRCRVNRLVGETGVCRTTLPIVASATLHPAPPESYTVFLAGCNFKCLNCQNWTISQYPDSGHVQRGYIDPKELAKECVKKLASLPARLMEADRIFFSGGEATIHLPYIEEVVNEARRIEPTIKVNYDTNGYMTSASLGRVLAFTNSITYDLKAHDDELFLALTGASSEPVLRNAEYLGRFAKDQLWEYRILVVPGINEDEIGRLTEFIAAIDSSLPVCFLAFRPNFALDSHPGANRQLMERCVDVAVRSGLENVYWSGHPEIAGTVLDSNEAVATRYESEGSQLAGAYAFAAGCQTHPRNCSHCSSNQVCEVKRFVPERIT